MLITEMQNCTGCAACENICPKNAISMKLNEEGFLYPAIDADLCINCNMCNKVCPVQQNIEKPHYQKAYAAWSSDDIILSRSSSGGVFSILANYILEQNGIVCGAAYDERNCPHHIFIDKKEDLPQLCGSKYVQSYIGDAYIKTKNFLKQGKNLLFAGTPCQIAALKLFLSKNYDNLITIDVACHGVPSPEIWKKYLSEQGQNITNVNFRDKSTGWHKFGFSYVNNGKKYFQKAVDNLFFKGFIKNLYLRKSCSDCRFANMYRPADFTLADFWGIQKYSKKLTNFMGTSLLITNNEKAENLLQKVKDKFSVLKEVPLQMAVKKNKVLYKSLQAHSQRNSFFELSKENSISELIAAKLFADDYQKIRNQHPNDKKIGIMNFHYSNTNYGALMVPYALTEVLKKYGFHPEIIDYIPKNKLSKDMVFENFREEYLVRSVVCKNIHDLELVSKNYSRFLTGSDQVFRWHANGKYLFNFVSGMSNLISYAGSFGKDVYDAKDKKYVAQLFSRFDALSVREKSGINIMKNDFSVDATWVLDPTLLLEAADYENIISRHEVITPQKKYIAYMFLNKNTDKVTLKNLQADYDLVDCVKTQGRFNTVAQWLNYIKNCDFLITDSFHGSVFATIFQKQFVCVSRDKGGNSRLESLFEKLGISMNRFYSDVKDIPQSIFNEKIDYAKVRQNLKQAQKESLEFLLQALNMPLTYKERLKLPQDNDWECKVFGVPMFTKKVFGTDVYYKIFAFIPLMKRIYGKKTEIYKLFNCLPFMSVKRKVNTKEFKLFGILPIIKIKL